MREWISVKENGPPDEPDHYLVVVLGDLEIRRWEDGYWWSGRAPVGNVSHYRPLPPPPQTDEDDV